MKMKKVYVFLLALITVFASVVAINISVTKAESVSDSSILSLTQDSDSFYVDAVAPYNVHVVNLNINDVEVGEVITVDLGTLITDQTPIVNGANVLVSGSIITFTFKATTGGAVSVPIRVRQNYKNEQKKLSDIQTAIDADNMPGVKTIVATDTRSSGVYEASIVVDAALTPYHTPDSVTLTTPQTDPSGAHNHLSGTYIKDQEYSFYGGFTSDFTGAELPQVRFTNIDITPTEISGVPGGFVLTGGTGWTQTGTTLTYDGSGNGTFSGKFTNALGTYTTDNATLRATGYFGYDTTPVTVENTAQKISVVITTAAVNPSLGVERGSLYINMFNTEDLHDRELPDIPPVPFVSTINTADPYISVPGDKQVVSAHWEFDIASAIKEVPLKDLSIPEEATNCVVTFQDGSTQVYEAGQKVEFDINNPATKITMDFGALPVNASIPISLNFSDENCTLPANTTKNCIFRPTITFVYNDASIYKANSAFYSYDLYTRDSFTSGLALDIVAEALQYGSAARVYRSRTSGGNWGSRIGSAQVYEPIMYTVLPLGVNYQGVTEGLPGYKLSTYTISTGQTVVKIDYTGSGLLIGTTTADCPAILYQPKAYGLSLISPCYSYTSAKNDPAMVLRANNPNAGITAPSAELASEITQGDDQAVLNKAANVSISGASYLMANSMITNNQNVMGQNATNDLVYGADHSYSIDLLNSTTADAGTLTSLTNLPDEMADLALNLTGPGVLKDLVSGVEINDSSIGEILYSTSKQTSTGGIIDESGYVSAGEVTDWSKIQSFIVVIKTMESNSEYTATFPITAPKAIYQLNKPVTISTVVASEGLNSTITSTDKFTSTIAIVHGTVSYDANTGTTSSLPEDQTTEDFLDIDTDNHGVTLSNTKPTKNADAYYIYTFKEWNTKADGSGVVYNPGDTIENIGGGDTVTLYAQWNETAIPAVSATLQYDANTGETQSIPGDDIVAFQPSTTGAITISSTIPTKVADAYYTYTFKEWNTKVDGSGTPYAAGSSIDNLAGGSTTTLYAQWNRTAIPPVSATLNYDANTGDSASLPANETTTFQPSLTGAIAVATKVPTKAADAYYTYSFKEWNTKVDGSGMTYTAGSIIEFNGGDTMTLYAQWNETEIPAVSAAVHYDANTGEGASLPVDGTASFQPSDTGTIEISSTIPTKAADAYYTYTFKEWNTQADGSGMTYTTGSSINNLAGGSTTTLYAQWNRTAIPAVSATLNYNANSGDSTSLPANETTAFQPSQTGAIAVATKVPTKTADAYYTYTFKEWNTQTDGSGMTYTAGSIIEFNGGESLTLYAQWNETAIPAVSATLQYDANTGDSDSLPVNGTATFQPSETGVITVATTEPSKAADAYYTYTFKEWNTKADGKGTSYQAGDIINGLAGGSTITLYAQWTETAIPAVSATLHYDANTGDVASLPVEGTATFQPSETGMITVATTIPTKNANAYYTYTFKEWNTQVDGKGTSYQAGDAIDELTGGDSVTLYAIWTETAIPAVSATLHYDVNTGDSDSLPVDGTATFQPSETGTITISEQVPTKAADAYYTYSFKEWNTQADGKGTPYQAEKTMSGLSGGSTTTLYAQWSRTAIPAVSATLHYEANTGNTTSLPVDETATFQPSETGVITVSTTEPTKNADAYYTYTFKEWNTQADGKGTPYQAADVIDELAGGDNVTLYAVWNEMAIPAVNATVHYDVNTGDDASLPVDETVSFQPSQTGNVLLSDMIPTKTADAYYTYTFKEWNTKADGTGTPYAAETTISGLSGGSNITLYAQWSETAIPAVSAALHYDANSGDSASLPRDETTAFQPSETGTIKVSTTIPTRTADAYYTYSFKEWNTQADGLGTVYLVGDEINNLMGGDTVTLYAQWNATIKSSTVTTHYVDAEGNKIADDVVVSDVIGSEYTTQSLGEDMLVNGEIIYTLVNTPVNATGTYTPEGIEVTYVYALSKSTMPDPIASSTVTVRHVDTNGVSIIPDVVMVGEVGHTYTTSALNGETLVIGDTRYELGEVSDNANGVYGMSNTVVTYVYTVVKNEVETPVNKPSQAPNKAVVSNTKVEKGYPDTGDMSDMKLFTLLFGGAITAMLLIVKRNRKEKE